MSSSQNHAGYAIEPDPGHERLTLRVWGRWDGALANAWLRELRMALGWLRRRPWDLLLDQRDIGEQDDEVLSVLSTGMLLAMASGQRRAATVIGGAQVPLQVQHLGDGFDRATARCFAAEQSAVRWLEREREAASAVQA